MPLLYFTLLQLTCVLVAFAVPSDINYQGRLSDANGNPVTGDVTMGVKLYDAQTGGNEIYSEDIGTVTLDENGVYSFQFGASGDSIVTKTETIVSSDGTSTDYTGTFSNTPIDGTVSVSDGTYSWNEVDGNPGEQATAYIIIINGFVIYADVENGGSGYDDDNPPLVTITGDGSGATATATVENGVVTEIIIDIPGTQYTEGDIVIAPPPSPFVVNEVDGNLEVQYASAPSNTTVVEATYKTLEPSIIGALSEASSHWLELSVDGSAQNPRERILSVPFAQFSGVAQALDQNNSAPVKYGKSKGEVSVPAGQTMEVLQLFNSRGDFNWASALSLYVSDLGYTAEVLSGLGLPFKIPGPSTVRASSRDPNGGPDPDSGFTYRIFDSNQGYRKSNVEISVAAGEIIEVVQLFNDQSNSTYENKYLSLYVSDLGYSTPINEGLNLPFKIPGPSTVRATGDGIYSGGLIYRIFNSDGSIKLKSDVEENDALNESVIPVSVTNQEAFNADHPVYFDNVWSDALEAGQSFTASNSMSIDSISFWISRLNHITGNFVLNLYNSIEPNTSIASKTFSVSEGEQSVTVVLNDPVELIEGDEYFFMIAPDTVLSEGNLYYAIGMGSNGEINDSTYEGGHQLFRSSNGSLMPTSNERDLKFMISLSEAVTGSSDVYPEFSIVEGSFTWQEAKADAESRGGRLAVLNTQEKIDLANNVLASIGAWPNLWIGLTDEVTEGDWKWITGDSLTAENWHNPAPEGWYTREDYGHIFGTDTNRTLYSWNDSPSGYDSEGPSNQNYYMSYLLELTAQGESSPNGPSEIIFSEGFHLIEGSYTWEEARLDAIAKGGRLAKLDSAEKNNLAHNSLSEYFALYPDANVYIGAKEQGEGNWLWSDGEPLTYSNFRSGQPSDSTRDNNAVRLKGSFNSKWDDGTSSAPLPYLLEIPSNDPYSNSPFSIVEGSFTWQEAKVDAESRGGRLAVLDTQDKINDSLLILATADYPKVWIGLRDHNNDNVDTWINGSPVSANNYGEGQPDSFGEIHIRTIEPNSIYGDPGQWLDEDSWKSFSYLLETLPE